MPKDAEEYGEEDRPLRKGQKSKEFREKRENIMKVERSNKMATGGSPCAWRLLIASSHLLTPP
jgi:hypothetical protein